MDENGDFDEVDAFFNDGFGNDDDERGTSKSQTDRNRLFDEDENEEKGQDGEGDGEPKKVVPVAKKRQARPQPKLDERLLLSDKGIFAFREAFADFKPSVDRDPMSQLDEILNRAELWAHRLFPKFKFEDVIARVDRLGDKRPVKVYMTKLRNGDPLHDVDFASLASRKTHNPDDDDVLDSAADDREKSKSPEPELSEEIRDKIEANRKRALEIQKRKAQEAAASQEPFDDPMFGDDFPREEEEERLRDEFYAAHADEFDEIY